MKGKTTRALNIIAFAVLLVAINSCSPKYHRLNNLPVPKIYGANQYRDLKDQQKRLYLRDERGYSNSIISKILNGTVSMGMTTEQARYSWGSPNDINRSVGSWGTHAQWVYNCGGFKAQYLYFENGRLTGWQD